MEVIKIYTTPTCVYCHALMEWLDEQGIKYEEIDATTMDDIDVVPLTIIGDEKIVGFDRSAFKQAFKKYGIK